VPSDADGPCERPLHGRRSCPSTHAPDDADDDAGPLREPHDDADETSWLPRARFADDADESRLPSSWRADDAGLRPHARADDDAWVLRSSSSSGACVLLPSSLPWIRVQRPTAGALQLSARGLSATSGCAAWVVTMGDVAERDVGYAAVR